MQSEEIRELHRRLVRYVLPENWQIKFKKVDEGIFLYIEKESLYDLFKKTNSKVLIEKTHPAYLDICEMINAIERDAYGSSEIYLSR